MKKIISEINQLGKLHIQLIETQNISSVVSQIKSNTKPITLENISLFEDLSTGKGLYVFFAKFPFNNYEQLLEFGCKWGVMQDKAAPANCPRFHKGNSKFKTSKKSLKTNEYIPLYLGKSENIKKRVLEHIDTGLDKTVYALKLKARSDILTDIQFKLGYLEFEIKDNSYFCVELLEKEVRKVFRPIVGKQ